MLLEEKQKNVSFGKTCFSLIKFRNMYLQTNILQVLNGLCYAGFSFFFAPPPSSSFKQTPKKEIHQNWSIMHQAAESILFK